MRGGICLDKRTGLGVSRLYMLALPIDIEVAKATL